MKKIIFVMNDHAEVGKTCVSAALKAYLSTQGFRTNYLAILGDESEENVSAAAYDGIWNILEENSPDRLFEWVDKSDALICDVETGYSDALTELYQSQDLDLALGEMDVELTIVTPQVEEAQCHESIQEIAAALSDKVYYVVPRVPIDEFSSGLEAWEESEACSTMDYLGAAVLDVPRITDSFQQLLESLEIPFSHAVCGTEDQNSDLTDQVEFWKRDFEHQLEDALDYIFPEMSSRHGFRRSA